MIPLERDFDLKAAQSEITRVIASLGFKSKLVGAGQRIFAMKCDLYDASGKLVASGLGKGVEQAAIVGAMFEATEHYLTNFRFLKNSGVHYLPSSYFSSKRDGILSALTSQVISQSHSGSLPCILHTSLFGEEKENYCPVGIFMPSYVDAICADRSVNTKDTYAYTRLGEYCSNTGVAIGMNKTESIIHGLLEALERDSLSRFIFDAFLGDKDIKLRKLDMNSLSKHLQSLVEDVVNECSGQDVSIYLMPNRFGIPAYCSWINKPVMGMYQAGFGCSLSEAHAVERSLYEVVQGHLSFTQIHPTSVVEQLHQKKLRNLRKYPPLLKCAEFDIARLEKLHGCESVKYNGSDDHSESRLEDYLQIILSRIHLGKSCAYTTELPIPVETDIKITHTIVGGGDRFMTVLGGRTPMPSSIYYEGYENGKIHC